MYKLLLNTKLIKEIRTTKGKDLTDHTGMIYEAYQSEVKYYGIENISMDKLLELVNTNKFILLHKTYKEEKYTIHTAQSGE
jgi:uncharacterized radical SAM superfamily protein